MLDKDFANGRKLNISTSLAIFTIIMGLLFLESAERELSVMAAIALLCFGVIWFFGDHLYHWWDRHHHDHHHDHRQHH